MSSTSFSSTSFSSTSFMEELRAYEGRQTGPGTVGPDPVNKPMIRHWCQTMGDTNPVYTDEEAAKNSVHGGIIAPPTMLQAWIMPGLAPRGPSLDEELRRLLDRHGFTSVVATNCEQEYLRALRPGDEISSTSVIESVSEEKQTALGSGHFMTTLLTFTDQDGEVVARMRFRILKFRPAISAPRPLRPRPALTLDNAWWFEGLRRHELLIQRCASCGVLRHPPRPMCDRCQSLSWDTVRASGRGTVFSFVVNHYPQVPAFEYPLPIGLIELAEGTRLVAGFAGVPPADVRIGMDVIVEFVDHDPELTLPAFRPA